MSEGQGLFPVVELPEFEESGEEYDREYKPSPLWDLEKGDFVRNASNKIVMADGLEAYRIWCVKVVSTARYACASYGEEIGSELDDALKEEDKNAVELAIERTIAETLKVNPRTESVEDFTFTWNGAAVKVEFWVHGIEWETFPLAIVIKVNGR